MIFYIIYFELNVRINWVWFGWKANNDIPSDLEMVTDKYSENTYCNVSYLYQEKYKLVIIL